MERRRTLNPTERKHALQHLNDIDNPQLHAFDYIILLTFLRTLKKRLLETEQAPFRITNLNIVKKRLALLPAFQILNYC